MSHANYTSTGCPAPQVLPHDPVPFFSDGELNFKAHDVGWLVCGICTVIASSTSIWLICKHLAFFYHPHEQRHIVRLLFMPVIYSVASFLSYFFYQQALYFQLGRDCYEALIIASFFFLLLSYLSNPPPTAANPHPQPYATKVERNAQLRKAFKGFHLDKWMWPLGRLKWRPAHGGSGEGEAFLWWMRVCIGQYVLFRPLSTLAAVIGEMTGYYCLASWSPKFVHIWSSAVICISVTIAMYAVLQLYMPLKKPLAPCQPVTKLLAVKLVIFFMFWQETLFSFLVTVGLIKHSMYFSAEEICIGLAAICACVEMVAFAFLHVKAFTYLPYRALAAPMPLDGSQPHFLGDDVEDEKQPTYEPGTPLTFAEWDAWEKRQKRREKALARLAKPKVPKHADDSDLPLTKPDGLPILQQTKKWPALLKCLNIVDICREIADEARFVFRGGRLDETDEGLLDDRRKDDLEAALGRTRDNDGSRRRSRDGRDNDETVFEQDLRHIREGRDAPKGAKVGADGSLVLPASHAPTMRNGHFGTPPGGERLRPPPVSRWAGTHETYGRRADEAKDSWWDSMKRFGSGGRRAGVEEGTFQQLPRLDYYAAVPVDNIPTLHDNAALAIPAPHQLDGSAISRPLPLDNTPPRQRSKLDQPVFLAPAHSPSAARKFPSNSSGDSHGHLPHETVRPTSYAPSPAKTPSPPPFSHFRRQSAPPLPPAPAVYVLPPHTHAPPATPDDGFTAYTPASSRFRRSSRDLASLAPVERPQPTYHRAHSHSQSVPVARLVPSPVPQPVVLPPPVLKMADPASRVSKGLPPGAGPAGS
ncbi:hypothetical protein JCM10213_007920 [Rhodosporidiobolus nylandii]